MAQDDSAIQRRLERIGGKFDELRARAEKVGMSLDLHNIGECATYQMGDAVKALFYSRNRPDGELYLKTELTCALADLLTQLRNLAWASGKDWDELVAIGLDRWEARIEDFEQCRGGLRPV